MTSLASLLASDKLLPTYGRSDYFLQKYENIFITQVFLEFSALLCFRRK